MDTTIWEDNMGALILSDHELSRMTPQSKHSSIKYHWFRSYMTPNGPKHLMSLRSNPKISLLILSPKV
eukprot:scaffold2847_cov405-Chaetoceros_neogracile.AAC.1